MELFFVPVHQVSEDQEYQALLELDSRSDRYDDEQSHRLSCKMHFLSSFVHDFVESVVVKRKNEYAVTDELGEY